jgi:hypothetical protein
MIAASQWTSTWLSAAQKLRRGVSASVIEWPYIITKLKGKAWQAF